MKSLKIAEQPHTIQRAVLTISALLMLWGIPLCAASGQEASAVGKVLAHELAQLEQVLVPLAEAMPADRYDFAPTGKGFEGVRTFASQISHVAVNIYTTSAAVLEEKLPPELGTGEYGPSTLKTKDDLITYLKGAFAYARKAMPTLTPANLTDEVHLWWGKAPRLYVADVAIWHSYDHYGQLVEYLRMNGIIPPASREKK